MCVETTEVRLCKNIKQCLNQAFEIYIYDPIWSNCSYFLDFFMDFVIEMLSITNP